MSLDTGPRDLRGRTQPAAVQHCTSCGTIAVVHVLEGYTRGRPVVRHFCLNCAERATSLRGDAGTADGRLGANTLALISGVVLVVIGLFGDHLLPDRHLGFGWRQQSGLWLSIVALLIGLLLRVDLLMLGGAFLLAGSLGADWFGLTSGPGVGWKQQIVLAVGATLVTGAAIRQLLQWVLRRKGTRAPAGIEGRPSLPTV